TLSKRFMMTTPIQSCPKPERSRGQLAQHALSHGRASDTLFFQKIWSILLCLLFSSFASPLRDLCMVTGKQNLGHFQTFEVRRPRVMRIVEQTLRERLRSRRRLAPQSPGNQSHNRINHHERRGLSTRQNIIADRNFVSNERLRHSLIDAFVTAANQNQLF